MKKEVQNIGDENFQAYKQRCVASVGRFQDFQAQWRLEIALFTIWTHPAASTFMSNITL